MSEKQYCSICGKRRGITSGIIRIVVTENSIYHCLFTTSDSTEPICIGHSYEHMPVTIPQAFYNALSDEEVSL